MSVHSSNDFEPAQSSLNISHETNNFLFHSADSRSQSSNQLDDAEASLLQWNDTPMATRLAQDDMVMEWLPYALRWPYLLATAVFVFLLEITVVVIHSISWRNSGLVADDGSGILQVGSKFAPTLLATIYVFLASTLLDDVKRTEPFARLSSPGGAQADLSVSWAADAWWEALFSSFPSRRKKTNWAMLCATLVFILGFLIISPLSSSLIVSQTVFLAEENQFLQLNINPSMPIQAKPLSKTYYRAISSVLRNVTTSAWISDQYAILPFWPASFGAAPLGPILFNNDQSWTATTSVFSTELDCEPIELKNISDIKLGGGFTGVIDGKNATLSSQEDCIINLQYEATGRFELDGGIIWATLNDISDVPYLHISGNGYSIPPSCFQDEFYSTAVMSPKSIILGEVCKASYFVGDSVVTASLVNGQSIVKIDERQYHANRKPISATTANISTFQNAFLSSDWGIHLSASDIKMYSKGQKPIFVGPGNLLAALYDFSPDMMRMDLAEHRRNITQSLKQRFFGELLRDCFDNSQVNDATKIPGVVNTSPRRLVVVSAVALTLEIVLIIILVLLSAIFLTTRLTRRPLSLEADPASAMSIAKILANDTDTIQSFLNLPMTTVAKPKPPLLQYRYGMEHGKVRLIGQEILLKATGRNDTPDIQPQQLQRPTDPDKIKKSTVFSIWPLIALAVLLTTVMVVIITLHIYSKGHKLYQRAFVYTISVSVKGVNLGDVNPASIITTLIAVTIGLWWGSIDINLRRVQPFLALAMGPVIGSKGVSISYRSSYLLWASIRAVRRKHWLLFLVCAGTFLSQIFTIAMSSLWSRQPGAISVSMEIPKILELRHVPIISTGQVSHSPRGLDRRSTALSNLFGNLRASWVYGAVVQLSLNGPEPPWSSRGWSFVPVDLAPATNNKTNFQNVLNGSKSTDTLLTTVTLETPAIRGRLECSRHNFLDNTSLWMTEWRTPENAKLNPNISHGYELRTNMYFGLYDSRISSNPLRENEDHYHPRTTIFTSDRRVQCCQNLTNGTTGQSSVGYWSPNLTGPTTYYPAISKVWPANFTVKWIRGHAVKASLSHIDGKDFSKDDEFRLIWPERPRMTALNCMPIIETADATVTVDATNGRVVNFKLISQPQNDNFAWVDDFLPYRQLGHSDTTINVNMTTSHGILFILGLLGTADLENLIGATFIGAISGSDSFGISTAERLEEQTFNIRDPGLNVDYMTYAMLSLVNNNYSALLDAETLERTAQQTFATFFQHFVNNKVSLTSGGYLYQSPDEKIPADIGELLKGFPNTTTTTGGDNNGNTTKGMIDMLITRPMEILAMSEPAAWVCILILGYLIITSVLLTVASKSYNRLLLRQVTSIADVVFLIARSNRLLKIAKERSLDSLKHDDTVEAKLDWFVTDEGDHRWGIDIVGKTQIPVSPAPSTQESNIFITSDRSSDAGDEVSWHDAVVSEIMAVGC